jgi:hypothetical protein
MTDAQRRIFKEYVLHIMEANKLTEIEQGFDIALDFFAKSEADQSECLMQHASVRKHQWEKQKELMAQQQMPQIEAQIAFYGDQCGDD